MKKLFDFRDGVKNGYLPSGRIANINLWNSWKDATIGGKIGGPVVLVLSSPFFAVSYAGIALGIIPWTGISIWGTGTEKWDFSLVAQRLENCNI